jgi:hypothetical protein
VGWSDVILATHMWPGLEKMIIAAEHDDGAGAAEVHLSRGERPRHARLYPTPPLPVYKSVRPVAKRQWPVRMFAARGQLRPLLPGGPFPNGLPRAPVIGSRRGGPVAECYGPFLA